jgi:hypothetical protein
MRVDGFRFDLATILAREPYGFARLAQRLECHLRLQLGIKPASLSLSAPPRYPGADFTLGPWSDLRGPLLSRPGSKHLMVALHRWAA